MDQYKIAVVVGSLRRDSFNRKLASALAKLGPSNIGPGSRQFLQDWMDRYVGWVKGHAA